MLIVLPMRVLVVRDRARRSSSAHDR